MPVTIRQAAVIPVRNGQVCMVTSSSGRRWVMPKGQIDPGHTAGEAALVEAWEEAGLLGLLSSEPIGSYTYQKEGKTHHVTVFTMTVTDANDVWPERFLRKREWVHPDDAYSRVEEEGLKAILALLFPAVEMSEVSKGR